MTALPPPEHPPLANGTVCVDLDGTIIPWGPLMGVREAFPGVSEMMHMLREAGYRIVILTSRLSEAWWKSEATARHKNLDAFRSQQIGHVIKLLEINDIPYDLVTSEKVPAEVYFDDKAIRITKDYPLDHAIELFLLGVYHA